MRVAAGRAAAPARGRTLVSLRMQIKVGVEALERGEFADVAYANLDRYLEGLSAEAARRVG